MNPEDMKNPTKICLYVIRETDSAIMVSEDSEDYGTKIFLPKSQIHCDDQIEPGDSFFITMPEWLAIQEGLV